MFCFARVLDESRSLMKCPPTLSLIYTGWNFCSTTWPRILQFPATNKSSWSFQSRSGGKKTRKTSQCNSVSEHPFWPVTSTQSATVTIEQVGECVAEPDWVLQNDKKKARGWGGWKDNKRPSSVKGLQTSRRGGKPVRNCKLTGKSGSGRNERIVFLFFSQSGSFFQLGCSCKRGRAKRWNWNSKYWNFE